MKYFQNSKINPYLPYAEAIFAARGINDVESYINPTRDMMHSWNLLDHIADGVNMLEEHLNSDSSILIVVDCDMDGICSAAMLWNYIKQIAPNTNLHYAMHEGKQHGIGDLVDGIIEADHNLVIIPDAGSNDYEYHTALREAEIDVLVIDHHEAEHYSDDAIVINNQLSADYPNKTLSGAGVVYKFLQAYDWIYNHDLADHYLDLAAAAIIADVMQLQELETRFIVHYGLNHLRNYGLKTFVEKQAYSLGGKLTPIGIGFYIAPIVNAIIRIGTMDEKDLLFRAFIAGDQTEPSTKRGHKPGDTEIVAEKAFRIGTNCRNKQNRIMDAGTNMIIDLIHGEGKDEYPVIYVPLDSFEANQIPSELTGLVAMRVCSALGKPTLIGRLADGGCIKGSIRNNSNSILSDLKSFLLSSGLFEFVEGHANAAGFSIPVENGERFLDYCADALKNIDVSENAFEVDYIFGQNQLADVGMIAEVVDRNKEIWGNNISEPRIAIEDIHFTKEDVFRMGTNKDSVKISMNGLEIVKFKDAIFANELEDCASIRMTAVGRLSMNEWGGKRTPQFIIEDYELANAKYDF